jgi:myxalamid-type nonribosomal peptide synthetase MxaA
MMIAVSAYPMTPSESRADELALHPSGATSARATIHQQLFWYAQRRDPDANLWLSYTLVVEGPLDRDALLRSLTTLVGAHAILRTTYREVDGVLRLYAASDDVAPPFDVHYADLSPLLESQWDPELLHARLDLAAGLDLDRGSVLRARLVRLAPDRHALVLVGHHIAIEVRSFVAFIRRLFTIYAADATGATMHEDPPRLQFVDFAVALEQWSETPTGRAASAYWRDRVRGVVPVELPVDYPRVDLDHQREVAPLGIAGDPMHEPSRVEVSERARTSVSELARSEGTTSRTVYLAALVWLLKQQTGQTDICIEALSGMAVLHPALHELDGMLSTWSFCRVNVAGCATLRDVIRRTETADAEARAHPIIDDYYRVIPHTVRRVVFNYAAPVAELDASVGELRIVPRRLPTQRWKRPWDLHVNLFETTKLPISMWTASETLFRRETVVTLQQRYLDLLVSET